MKKSNEHLDEIKLSLKELILQIPFSVIIGIIVGVIGYAFDLSIEIATEFRGEHGWLLYCMPIAGLVIVFLYNKLGFAKPRGTNRMLDAANKKEEVSLLVAPLIFVATTLTHLVGGSSGREGAALQLGGSISNFIGRKLKLGKRDLRVLTMSGMAAGFSALFGTPLAAAFFALEVGAGRIQYAALFPCLSASLIARITSAALGGKATSFNMTGTPELSATVLVQVLILGIIVAMLARAFCQTLHLSNKLYAKYLKNQYLRVIVGSALVILLTLLIGNRDYNGAGMAVINKAFEGEALPYSFALKLILTALTLGCGFKGGEIVPSFFCGATFGCVIGNLIGLPASFGAGLGLVMMFAGVTNCPIASILLAYELYGGNGLVLCAFGILVSYIFSGNISLYHTQILSDRLFMEE